MDYSHSYTYTPRVPSWVGPQDSYIVPPGMGQDLMQATARQIATSVADQVVKFVRESKVDPKLMEEMTAAISRGSEPMVKTVVREEVMPKVIFWGVLGLLAVGALSSFIAVQTIKARRKRNPRRVYRMRSRRRMAA